MSARCTAVGSAVRSPSRANIPAPRMARPSLPSDMMFRMGGHVVEMRVEKQLNLDLCVVLCALCVLYNIDLHFHSAPHPPMRSHRSLPRTPISPFRSADPSVSVSPRSLHYNIIRSTTKPPSLPSNPKTHRHTHSPSPPLSFSARRFGRGA
jgi:hypothetical protein